MSFWRREPTEPSASTPPGAAGEPPADETQTARRVGDVPGERGIPSVNRVRSVQSRVTSVLAVTLMGALAAALMIWYYSGAIHRSARAQQLAEAATKRRAQGDTTLPSLGSFNRRELRRLRSDCEPALDRLVRATAAASGHGAGDSDGERQSVCAAAGPPPQDARGIGARTTTRGPGPCGGIERSVIALRAGDGRRSRRSAAECRPAGLSPPGGESGESNESADRAVTPWHRC